MSASPYLDWKVGDRVACVVSADRIALMSSLIPEARYPSSDGIYTIREIRDDNRADGLLVLLLTEVDNRHLIGVQNQFGYGHKEPGFPIIGFRKVQPRKTDISIFTAMLHGKRSEVDA